MSGVLSHIQAKMAEFTARNLQGQLVFQLTQEQYDALATELTARGAKHGFEGRPALMVYGAKVLLK